MSNYIRSGALDFRFNIFQHNNGGVTIVSDGKWTFENQTHSVEELMQHSGKHGPVPNYYLILNKVSL